MATFFQQDITRRGALLAAAAGTLALTGRTAFAQGHPASASTERQR